MKIRREAKTQASRLFRACVKPEGLDEPALLGAVEAIAQAKPRHADQILRHLLRLAEKWQRDHTYTVRSAVPLADRGASFFESLQRRFGRPSQTIYTEDASLLGGVSLQWGDNVWDASVQSRLVHLQKEFQQP